jgi:DNA modification methylase
LGLEETPEEYIANLMAVFSQVWRVLRDDGTLWLNIGDSYAGSRAGTQGDTGQMATRSVAAARCRSASREMIVRGKRDAKRWGGGNNAHGNDIKPKDLIGIPWMLAFALRAAGWYLRQDIIWSKPNPMPESVRDRCTKSHEYLFLLTKSPRYFYDQEAILEPASPNTHARIAQDVEAQIGSARASGGGKKNGPMKAVARGKSRVGEFGVKNNPSFAESVCLRVPDRNKRSVWTIATQPFKEAHFATFPPALVEPCLLAGASRIGCCKACGAPWVRKPTWTRPDYVGPTCRHGRATPVPCTVLDPFFGAGTTGLVADRLQFDCIGIELKHLNVEIAYERIHGDAPLLAKVSAA